jgi:potassium efflux system protein
MAVCPETLGRNRVLASAILATFFVLVGASRGEAWQGEPASQPSPPRESSEPSSLSRVARSTGPAETEPETEALRRQTSDQLKALDPASLAAASASVAGAAARPDTTPAPGSSAASPSIADKQLHQVLQERLRLLDEYEKASIALKAATHPEPSPEKQMAADKQELGRLQAVLAQAVARPEVLLPQAERARLSSESPASIAELKELLQSTTNELKECKSKLETLRSEIAKAETRQTAFPTDRDKLFQRVTQLKARGLEREPLAGSATVVARRLAQERSLNVEWESRVEALRLRVLEAQIALEPKVAGVRDQAVHVYQARIQVLQRALALMQTRYRAAAEREERELTEKAAREESTALRSADPLEQFRANQLAGLLKQEAEVVKIEQAEATSPPPSLDEQRSLADRTQTDFTRIKELVEDGQVSRLDAVRLNNEFRRIGPERDRLLRNEMAIIETRLQFYEDELTKVEIDLLQDSFTDRSGRDLLRERLPQSRWGEGEGLLAELEQKHRALLVRRRAALERLTHCAAQTLDQIARRLSILDEEYGFIRTHIFWVRDQEPIGLGTLGQGAREFQHTVKSLLRLVEEAVLPGHGRTASAEFVTAALAALTLPIGLVRLRRGLRARIERYLRS